MALDTEVATCKYSTRLVENVYECIAKSHCEHQFPCDSLILCGLHGSQMKIVRDEAKKLKYENQKR